MLQLGLDLKVLVVESSERIQRIIRSMLKQFGFKDIQEASNERDGLAKLRTGDFGLVFADWNMPEMTGTELLRAIRKDVALSELPVVMLTARNEKEYIQEALKVGV